MIQSLDGPVLMNNAFGTLLSFNLSLMLKRVENPKICGEKAEYGVPFFDDLDGIEKATLLHSVIVALFDPQAPLLKESAYHAATLIALENYVKKNVSLEINMQDWFKKKYGEEMHCLRELTVAAFQSRYPNDCCPQVESTDTVVFVKMIDRLFADIRPKPYFFADVPKTKRKDLIRRLALPNDYFVPLGRRKNIPEKDKKEQCRILLSESMDVCRTQFGNGS
jgi:hypothetical protein